MKCPICHSVQTKYRYGIQFECGTVVRLSDGKVKSLGKECESNEDRSGE